MQVRLYHLLPFSEVRVPFRLQVALLPAAASGRRMSYLDLQSALHDTQNQQHPERMLLFYLSCLAAVSVLTLMVNSAQT